MPGHADGVPVAGQADPGGEVAGVVFRCPDAIPRHLDRREPEPLRARRAMDIPVQPRVVHEDLQAAADKQDQEHEVDVVRDAQPARKAKGPRRRSRRKLGNRRERWKTGNTPLDVRCGNQEQRRQNEQQKCLASNVHGHPLPAGIIAGGLRRSFSEPMPRCPPLSRAPYTKVTVCSSLFCSSNSRASFFSRSSLR